MLVLVLVLNRSVELVCKIQSSLAKLPSDMLFLDHYLYVWKSSRGRTRRPVWRLIDVPGRGGQAKGSMVRNGRAVNDPWSLPGASSLALTAVEHQGRLI